MNKFYLRTIVAAMLATGIALPSLAQDPSAPRQGAAVQGGRGRGGRGRSADQLPEEAPAVVPKAPVSTKPITSSEQFFIIASIDQAKSQILFKRPTEVTLLMNVDGKTQYTDDSKNRINLANFRTGDTVWVRATGTEDNPTAASIRKGQMTVSELHNSFLDYPIIK